MMGPVQAAPDAAVTRSFGGRLIDIAEVGRMDGFLARGATLGETRDSIYVDAGLHNMA
jgi:enoyl-[acyl-carrier protein] reductase I